jgi:hypothetical protein
MVHRRFSRINIVVTNTRDRNALCRPTVNRMNIKRLFGNLNAATILKSFKLIDMREAYFIGGPKFGLNDPAKRLVMHTDRGVGCRV